jgi:hypothetical protein
MRRKKEREAWEDKHIPQKAGEVGLGQS